MHVCTTCLKKPQFSTAPAHGGMITQIQPPHLLLVQMTHTKGSKLYTHAWQNHARMHDYLKNRSFLSKASSWGWDFSNLTKTPQNLPSSNWPKTKYISWILQVLFIWRINRVKTMVETCPWLHSTHSFPPPLILTQERASLGFEKRVGNLN